jgi:glutamate carboxypeptidase
MKLLAMLALVIAAATVAPAEARLRPEERRMVAAVDREAGAAIELLQRLVDQNSGTLNLEGVEEVGRMVGAELAPLGFEVDWIDMRATGRAGHLVATHRGNGRGQRILLIGHLDTVFEPDSPFQTMRIEGGRAIGPGVGDDKGGIVVMIAALRAMHAAGTLRDADIRIVLTGDEERSGRPLDVARRDLIEAGRWADVALEYENVAHEDGRDYATLARRSSSSWTLRVQGRTGHSSGVFNQSLGFGAIYELARILDEFRRELIEPYATFNVGLVGGGTPATLDAEGVEVRASGKTNIIAETAIARGDLRTLTAEQEARLRARMAEIAGRSLRGTGAELVFDDSYPPMEATEANRALLARLNAVNRDLGLPEMAEFDPARRGAADSSFVARDAVTLAGMGAAGGGAHAEGEWIEIASLARQAKRSALLITRLARTPRADQAGVAVRR